MVDNTVAENTNNYLIETVAADVFMTTLSDLEIWVDYEIKVAAYNAMGNGPFSQPQVVFVGEAGKIFRWRAQRNKKTFSGS